MPGFNESDVYYHGATAVAIEAEILNSTAQVQQALARMRKNVALACAPATNCSHATIGLTLWPPYPNATNAPAAGHSLPPAPGSWNGWGNGNMKPGLYQNAGDWTWMGARMVQQLVKHNMLDDALQELRPFVDRVCEDKDFREWYDPQVLIARLHQTGLIFLIISLLMHSIGITSAVSRVQWVFVCALQLLGTPGQGTWKASGANNFHGSAGELGTAIKMLHAALEGK